MCSATDSLLVKWLKRDQELLTSHLAQALHDYRSAVLTVNWYYNKNLQNDSQDQSK